MKIGEIEFLYLAHASFLFRTPQGKTLLTDPFFAGGFEWHGRWEKHLSPPELGVRDVRECDVIFVSHSHGDHFDPDAILSIQERTEARVLAAGEILEVLRKKGADVSRLVEATEGACHGLGDLAVRTYAGYDDSYDRLGRPNKFSLLIETGPTRLFYSGDCHELPPAVRGMSVAAMFCWPHTDAARLEALCRGISASRFVIMHCDRFEPGDFLCNKDVQAEKRRIETIVPGIEVVVPERHSALP